MASQRVNRYIAVQRAKGLDPDPQQVARLIRDDTETSIGQRSALVGERRVAPGIVEDRTDAIRSAVPSEASAVSSFSEADRFESIGAPDISNQTLGQALGTQHAENLLLAGAGKTGFGGTVAAATAPPGVSKTSAFMRGSIASFSAPLALAAALNTIGGASYSAGLVGENIEKMFGQQAAIEATEVISGRADLSSISFKGQQAYANAMVAWGQSPKSFASHLWRKLTGKPGVPTAIVGTPAQERFARGETYSDPSTFVDPISRGGFEPMGLDVEGGEGRFEGPSSYQGDFEPMGITGRGRYEGPSDFEPMGLGDDPDSGFGNF